MFEFGVILVRYLSILSLKAGKCGPENSQCRHFLPVDDTQRRFNVSCLQGYTVHNTVMIFNKNLPETKDCFFH